MVHVILIYYFNRWNHYDHDLLRLPDPALLPEAQKGVVSYVFQYISHMK
jgi:DNA repair and recombination RAD54-like protein